MAPPCPAASLPTSSAAISSNVSARRTSPSDAREISMSCASATINPRPPSPRSLSASACWSASTMSSSDKASITCTRQRESSAEFNSNDGFSVVAPTNRIEPRSICGRNASCWVLLKRCTSSTNNTVRVPCVKRSSAAARICRTSGSPESTAEMARNSAFAYFASSSASVVLPQPGGPHRIIECTWPDSIARRNEAPSPSNRRCPTISSRMRGRIRSASGFNASGAVNNGCVWAGLGRATAAF